MYVPRNGDMYGSSSGNSINSINSESFPNTLNLGPQKIPEALLASISLPIITLTLIITCLGVVKRTARYFSGRRAKKTVQCSRISVISTSESTRKMPTTFRLDEFRQHYNSVTSDSCYQLSIEFEELRANEAIPCTAADNVANRLKNRFVNVLPFDHSRVVLKSLEDTEGSDYINANYISGFYASQEYIATQGPLKSTVTDFWRMCWETGTKAIVMLTRCIDKDREKCSKYWPSSSLPEQYGEIEVEIIKETVENFVGSHEWVVTDLCLRLKNEERTVRHYQLLSWPDFGAVDPPEALIQFIRTVREYAPYPDLAAGKTRPPIVIHCSAGVGRSGTFISVDIAMQQVKIQKQVDIFGIVQRLRRERIWMVQTEQQYLCVYKCVMALLEEMDAQAIYAARQRQKRAVIKVDDDEFDDIDYDLDSS